MKYCKATKRSLENPSHTLKFCSPKMAALYVVQIFKFWIVSHPTLHKYINKHTHISILDDCKSCSLSKKGQRATSLITRSLNGEVGRISTECFLHRTLATK